MSQGNMMISRAIASALLLLLTLFWAPVPLTEDASASSIWTQAGLADFANGTFNGTVPGGAGGVVLDRALNCNWSRVSTSPTPSARGYHGMATTFADGRVMLFGGWNGSAHLNDTWVFDPQNGTWTDVSAYSAERPDSRDDYAMAPVWGTDAVILFGGDPNGYSNDTWIFNAIPARWHILSPPLSPSARVQSSMATVDGAGKLVLFGGWDGSSILNDTWIFDLASGGWTQAAPPLSPPARDNMALAGVPGDDKVVLFGGKSGAYIFNDTWVFDVSALSWQQLFPSGAPAPSYANTLVSFESSDDLMLFGGQGLANETWILCVGDNNWTRQFPVNAPYARYHYGMARISGADRALMFGGLGTTSGNYLSSTWVFNLTSYAPDGTFTSAPVDLGGQADISQLWWNASTPDGTSIWFRLRGAQSSAGLQSTEFFGPDGTNMSYYDFSGRRAWSGLNGSTWVQYRAYLASDRPESTPVLQNVSLGFDLLPGAPLPLAPAEGAWVNSSTAFTWNFTDADSSVQGGFQFQMDQTADFSTPDYDSGQIASANASHVPSVGDGSYMWRVRTRDRDGAWGPYSAPRLARMDSTVPDIVLIAPCASVLETQDFTMYGTASDTGAGLYLVEVQADQEDWLQANGTTNWRIDLSLSCGHHTVRIRAQDNVSNGNMMQLGYNINRAPVASILAPADGSEFNVSDRVELSATAFDLDGDALSYVWKDGGIALGTGTVLAVKFPVGPHNISVTVSDGWGHEATDWVNITSYTVIPRPTVIVFSPAEGEVLSDCNLSANFTIENATAGSGAMPRAFFSLDGQDAAEANASPVYFPGLADGNHTLSAWLVDAAGHNLTGPGAFAMVNFSVLAPWRQLSDISLDAGSLVVKPTELRAKGTVSLSFIMSNRGVLTSPNFTLRLYVDGALKGQRSFQRMAPGSNLTVKMTWTASAGNHSILIAADDPAAVTELDEGNNALNITLSVGPAAVFRAGIGIPTYIAVGVLVCALAAGFIILGRRRLGAGSAARMAGAEKAPDTRPLTDPFTIEDVFLIYGDGRLIQHTTRRLGHVQSGSEIMASMLTAVQVFIKDALSKGEEAVLGSMEYSGRKILLEGDKHLILAVVIDGPEPDGLRSEMVQTLSNIRAEFGTIIPQWDGDMSTLAGTERFLSALSAFRSGDVAALENRRGEKLPSEVKVLSEVEFFQGFARLKVAVKNEGQMLVADAALDLHFDDEILRLDRIEPAYPQSGKRVVMGNIGPREKKSVAFYLDPQICTESAVDGVLTYRDAKGEFHTASLKRRMVTVVCPILHTEENINTAMLRRTIAEELDQKDSKVFNIPSSVTTVQAFALGKRAVEAHDVRFVREFSEKEPYKAEAWYFGRTMGRDAKMVIKVTARDEGRTLEFMVASNSRLAVTGLLAELRADLVRRQKETAPSAPKIEQSFDGALRERLVTERPLLDKYSEGDETT